LPGITGSEAAKRDSAAKWRKPARAWRAFGALRAAALIIGIKAITRISPYALAQSA
jgi:hypothetical protein